MCTLASVVLLTTETEGVKSVDHRINMDQMLMTQKSVISSPINSKQHFNGFKQMLSYPYWNYVTEIINSTKSYEEGYGFAERMSELLNIYASRLDAEEYKDFDKNLLTLKLSMLDKLDRWFAYLHFFETIFYEKPYELTYSIPATGPELERFGRYLLRIDEYHQYIHFLYPLNYRYEVIQRKIQRLQQRKSVSHLMHHQQHLLTDEEIEWRYQRIMTCIQQGLPLWWSSFMKRERN